MVEVSPRNWWTARCPLSSSWRSWAWPRATTKRGESIEGGAVTIGPNREKISDPKAMITIVDGLIVRVGNRNVKRVALKPAAPAA